MSTQVNTPTDRQPTTALSALRRGFKGAATGRPTILEEIHTPGGRVTLRPMTLDDFNREFTPSATNGTTTGGASNAPRLVAA
ncbi:MAG: hypothetical protein H6865_00215 [Rhodospirillales bacterium]|nr:hypothetical protein [Alphaproteobacteria bacterium]MCB9986049.1 hypothetical protein [Rhodospirillales bacterium]USO07380.1 MAG: hypothetical protein H6866_08155 [Rhodospirillales bacterium]